MKSNTKTISAIFLELPVGMDIQHPELIAAIRERYPWVKVLYRPEISSPELYFGCNRVCHGFELLRHMYLKPKYLKKD